MSHSDWCKDENCGHKRREPKPVKTEHFTRGFVTEWRTKQERPFHGPFYYYRMPKVIKLTLHMELDDEQAFQLQQVLDVHKGPQSFDTQAVVAALAGGK